jgi:hypothetical protein
MTNDAKLGLVVGIGLVILIAIIFFRKDPAAARAAPTPATVAAVPAAGEPHLQPIAPRR